ncbi:methionine synthase [Actinomycetospora sp. NBRC 106375]|uniref:cobalamin-independent methionine synthase II family protein n=1 Tax=Actinomycetospora sp. NBRC 106375 TaxID=3032207 RepID=UPI00249FED28|nr:cobalamin-independent methionine synthase II family protein [Actinomycetospora sp. NBRC 106375]GLZ48341.1 methionine synthase [Actinomycetospora sp. NBRC 106375]
MQRSTERFLTTHVGSLPRPDDLVRTMFAQEEGVPVDRAALAERVRAAVAEVVGHQLDAGIDLVNDGEMSKPSYASYPKYRLTGFDGESVTFSYRDLDDFPSMAQRVMSDPGRSRRKTPACTGPVAPTGDDAVQHDVANLLAADGDPTGRFLTAASPGLVALFFDDQHYGSYEDYLLAIADAMRPEYEAIAAAGITVQLDCPDLAMGRHVRYADLSDEQFLARLRQNLEAIDHATAGIDPELLRLHVCWGNYDGPHHRDIPFATIVRDVLRARPAAIAFEAANPRHAHEFTVFDDVALPDGTVLVPGVLESKTNVIEHPELVAQRIARYAERVGAENVVAGTDCGYGTWVGQAAVDPQVVWAKFAALAEGARLASDRWF